MQRTSFDVNSIAALLRQTEANLAALKPRQEAQRYSGEPIFSSTLPYTSSAPVRSQVLGSGVELETQVVQLRTCIETLERRLEEELRSFLAISDKRLQAREEQLRGIGETLQASADAAMEQLNRRVDTRLRDLERAGLAPSALDEIWEALKRLEGDCQDLDGKLRRAASADDLADRFKEVERAQVQRFDERLATQEKRMSDMRLQLQTANEEFLQAINRRCEVLEKIVWEGQTDKGDIETVFKRLAEAAPIREMQDEINACNYEKEVQRTRLTTLEAKLSKQAALESKVDFMESQTSQQLEEQAQKFRHVSELQHKLSQKLASTEAASQRVEAQGASLQAKLQSQLDEERERMHSSFDALQQRVTKQLEEVEGRASRGSKRSEQDLVEHVNALTQKLMEESINAQKQAEKRLHTVDERSDQVIQAARSQMEKAIQDLKMDAEVAKNAMDAELQRMDRFVQEIGSKMSSQEGQLLRLSDMDIQRSRIEAVESKLNEVQGEQRLLRDLKSIMDAHKLQADRRLGDLDSALASVEEQIREKDRRRNNDVDEHRARFEGFENRLTELQVSQVRHKTSVENLDVAVTSLEPLRASVTTLQGGLAAVEEQIRSRAQELSQDMQQSWNSQNSLTQRMNAMATDVGNLQHSLEGLKLTSQGLDARGETLLNHMSSVEGVVQSIQDRLASGPLEGSPRAPRVEIQELVAMSESRTLQRSKSEVENLRLQLSDLRGLLHDGLDARVAAAGELDRKVASMQDTVLSLRAEVNAARGDAQESSIREARLGAEVRSMSETLSIFQNELRATAAKCAGQIEDTARLDKSILALQQQQRDTNFANTMSSLDRSGFSDVASPGEGPTTQATQISISAARQARAEERLRRVEDVVDMLPPKLQERLRMVENNSSSSEAKTGSAATAAVNAVTNSIAPQMDELRSRFSVLNQQQQELEGRVRRAEAGLARSAAVHQPPREPVSRELSPKDMAGDDQSPRLSELGARLCRIEDQLLTLDSLDTSALESSALPVSGATLKVALNWTEESISEEDIRSALQEATADSQLTLLRVDSSRESQLSGWPRAVCWLAASQSAEAQLRQQLEDPRSQLYSQLPGLQAEISSVSPPVTRHLATRVSSLEEAQRQLAEGLSGVERQVLNIEGRLAGSLGVTSLSRSRATFPALPTSFNSSSLSPEPAPRFEPAGRGIFEPTARLHSSQEAAPDEEGSVRDLDFDNLDASPQRLTEEQRRPHFDSKRRAQEADDRLREQSDLHRKRMQEEIEEKKRRMQEEAEEADRRRREQDRQREEEERKKREEEEQSRRVALEQQRQQEQELRLKEAEEKKRREAEAQRKREEEQERRDAEEKKRKEAEEQKQREVEEKARREAEEQKQREAEEQARKEADEQRRKEAKERERKEEEQRQKEVEEQARKEADEKKKKEEEEAKQRQKLEEELKEKQREEEAKRKQEEAARAGVTQPKQPQTPTSQASQASSQASQGPKPGFDKPRRQRVTGKPATARASARSKDDEIQKVFNDIGTGGSGVLTLEDLQSYLCDHLGFGQAEALGFMQTFGQGDGVSMEGFKKGYARLTPFLLSKRQNEVLIRKAGSLSSMGPQSLQIEELDDCEVYICEVTNTIFVDECKRCAMLIGPCETSVFVRDCEDCVFWIAAQQLRTRGCKRCKFFLYSKTEPVIEASQDLAFAPWSASYPCAKAHFQQFGFNPEVNLWNAIFDFSGKTGTSNWRILGLEEVSHISVELEDPPPKPSPDDPAAPVTYEVLCAPPMESGESCGQSVGSIPQTRPALPAAPPSTFKEVKQLHVQDGAKLSVFEQLKQSQSLKAAPSPGSSPENTGGGLAMAALAGKTFMEVAGGSLVQNPKEEIESDTEVSALGMASLAGQALMEAGTTVVGTMDVDDEDSSGETPRIKQLAPPASVTTLSGAHAKPKAAMTPAEVKKQLQKQLGESSDEEELPQAKPKSMPLPKSRIARQIGDSEDDEDSDIERAMKAAAAEAARSRQAPGASGAGSSKTPLNTFAPAASSVQSEQKGMAASDSDDDNFFDDDEELPM